MLKCDWPSRLSICCKSACNSRSVREAATRGANSARTASQSTPPKFGSKWLSLTVCQTMSKASRRRSASVRGAAAVGAAATTVVSERVGGGGAGGGGCCCRPRATGCSTKIMRKRKLSGLNLDIRLLAGTRRTCPRLELEGRGPGKTRGTAARRLLKHPPGGACQTFDARRTFKDACGSRRSARRRVRSTSQPSRNQTESTVSF
jgi:hypothetical protein